MQRPMRAALLSGCSSRWSSGSAEESPTEADWAGEKVLAELRSPLYPSRKRQ
jgi:hypothetical protein